MSPLPASFLADGFVPPEIARRKVGSKFRRLMVFSQGKANTGKTEFALSAPTPGLGVIVDRGFDAMFDNPTPPPTRRDGWGFNICRMRLNQGARNQDEYAKDFVAFAQLSIKACDNPDARTVLIDGDSDTWETQRLGEHGALTGIFPQTKYTSVYAARRAFYNRLWDSGKIIISTNKVKEGWRSVIGPDGLPVRDANGEEKRERSGEWEPQGFPDREFLWSIQISHLYEGPRLIKGIAGKPNRMQGARWGIEIIEAKAHTMHKGTKLWGDDCCFAGLVSLVYPHVPLNEWGY